MTFYRLLYFLALTGALAGLLGAGTNSLVASMIVNAPGEWLADSLVVLILALFLAPLLLLQLERFSGKNSVARTIGIGVLIAVVTGVLSAAVLYFLRVRIAGDSPALYRLLGWTLSGSILALGIGMRSIRRNRTRVFHTYAGGIAGGLLGGLVFVGLGTRQPELSQAVSLMLTGAGVGFGAGLAPLLVGESALEFISSADARAQSKYGRPHKRWDLSPEETYIVGSLATSQSDTRFQPGADIFVPDASMAPRHAVIYSKEGRYYIARHPDAGGPAGIAKYILRVRGKTVTSSQELNEADDILAGRTALRFMAKRRGE